MRVSPFLLLLALTVLGTAAPRPARADATDDAVKAFRSATKAEDWKQRREAYLLLADFDGGAAAEAMLDAMERETNPAVILGGIGVLSGLRSEGAQAALLAELGKSRGSRKMHVLLALSRQPGDAAVPLLLETVQGKDEQAAAQAALALGAKEVKEAIPHLVKLLASKDWQLRRAGAMALRAIAQPPPPKPKEGETTPKDFRWPVPEAMKDPAVTKALVDALAVAKGRDRNDLIATLEEIHEKDYGLNLAAWKLVAQGKQADERTLAKRERPAYVFGIPIYGQRVVLIYDNSLRSADPHRFGSDKRLMELCEVPGARPLLHMRLRTVGQFARAHYERCIRDMPKGTRFELIHFNEVVQQTFGKFASASTASRRVVEELFATLKSDNGIATFDALNTALDLGGAGDAAAWKKGPDEIVFVTCNVPTAGEITDADVVGAAIALKARLRMVPIHTIGIETHPYGMLETIAKQTGAVYRNYYE